MSTSRRLAPGLLVAGILAVGGVPRTAHAQGEFERHLIAASRLYESLDYERAVTQIELARKMPHSADQEVQLSLYEGIIRAELGEQEDSVAAFKSALLVQPEAVLPVKVSPKVHKLFESVREQVKRELASLPPRPAPEPPKPVATSAPPEPTPEITASRGSALTGLRRAAPVTAIVGGTLVVAGGISYALARGELSRLRDDASDFNSREEVQSSASKGKTLQTVGVSLLGVGTAALAAAAGGYLLGSPDEPVAVGVGTDGTSAFVFGRWP